MLEQSNPPTVRFAALDLSGPRQNLGEVWHATSETAVSQTTRRVIEPGLHIGCGIARMSTRGRNGDCLRSHGTTFITGWFEANEEFETQVEPGEIRCVGIRICIDELSGDTLELAEKVSQEKQKFMQHSSPLVTELVTRLTAPFPAYCDPVAAQLFLEARGLELLGAAHSVCYGSEAPSIRQRHLKLAQDARAFIDENLHKDITICGLAREIGSSERVLTSAFRQAFGETVARYTTRKRMEHALALLRLGQPVAQAASSVNYSPNALSAAFKQYYGVTPKAARSMARRHHHPMALKTGSPT
ncbi:MAG: AraC family transcriptional regulator [Pseudomonadota bacterium]